MCAYSCDMTFAKEVKIDLKIREENVIKNLYINFKKKHMPSQMIIRLLLRRILGLINKTWGHVSVSCYRMLLFLEIQDAGENVWWWNSSAGVQGTGFGWSLNILWLTSRVNLSHRWWR